MVPCANNKLNIDTSDELKINVDNLDELLRTVEEHNLAALQRVHFIYNFNDNVPGELELRTARFLGALPQLQTLQLDGWTATEKLLQRAIAEASVTPFAALKTVIWGSAGSPLNELLPLWELPVEHIEVSADPAPRSHKNVMKLLRLSPCLESLRYDHWCHVERPKQWEDCSLLTAALQQVKSTLRSVDLYDHLADEVDYVEVRPVSGQPGPLRELSCLRKLKAPIVMLLGWSPDDLLLPLEEVVPAGLTHLGLTEDLAAQCTYEWNEELVLEALVAFLSVWDCHGVLAQPGVWSMGRGETGAAAGDVQGGRSIVHSLLAYGTHDQLLSDDFSVGETRPPVTPGRTRTISSLTDIRERRNLIGKIADPPRSWLEIRDEAVPCKERADINSLNNRQVITKLNNYDTKNLPPTSPA
ncbi:hypothetical protein V8E54_003114 [Elaphomyces granulatus]